MQELCQKASGFVFCSMHAADGKERLFWEGIRENLRYQITKDIRLIVQRAFACKLLLESRCLHSEPPIVSVIATLRQLRSDAIDTSVVVYCGRFQPLMRPTHPSSRREVNTAHARFGT